MPKPLSFVRSPMLWSLPLLLATQGAQAYTVPISDTDDLREVCSGMWGGSKPYIEVSFDPTSSGQVAMVIYEWKDVTYLGVDTPDDTVGVNYPKTYICTTSAVRSGLCSSSQLGDFITSLPSDTVGDSSIYTSALRFGSDSSIGGGFTDTDDAITEPWDGSAEDESQNSGETFDDGYDTPLEQPDPLHEPLGSEDEYEPTPVTDEYESTPVDDEPSDEGDETGDTPAEDDSGWGWWKKRQILGDLGSVGGIGIGSAMPQTIDGGDEVGIQEAQDEGNGDGDGVDWGDDVTDGDWIDESQPDEGSGESTDQGEQSEEEQSGEEEGSNDQDVSGGQVQTGVQTYTQPIRYPVPKTGYYCIGVVPVTLLDARGAVKRQDAQHAEYSGSVLFQNTFDGELPAVEYPKINFYLALSAVYVALGIGWAYLCLIHRREILPMQYYISGTIVFLIIEMTANFAYYRYINKHGGGASSLAFLFVVSILSAARNSLSFFLLLIVCMGLSVVTQSLGTVMTRVRILTGFHFIFGVLYAVGTVEVELDRAALAVVFILILPLALTLTAFLMWIIVSLNGTIVHLRAQKQGYKLRMFQRLWRILIIAVVAVAGFFVLTSLSLSNRLEEDYAPNNWRWRWILLDGSLATIYLCVFSAIAWLWRPTRDNVRFSMSQQLAQDEAEADAEDYEIDNLDNGRVSHQPLPTEDDEDESFSKPLKGRGDVGEENVVFAMGDDSDEEEDGKESHKANGFKDDEEEEPLSNGVERSRSKDD